MKYFIPFLIACLVIISNDIPRSMAADDIRAGVARIDITPPEHFKAPLGGYGERMGKPALGVHDRIFAKALVVSQGNKKFALVTADMLGFPPIFKPTMLDRLAKSGWNDTNVILLASHSHTSINIDSINPLNVYGIPQIGVHNPELFDWTISRFAQVIDDASKSLQKVAVGTISSAMPGWNVNRRNKNGIVDDELTITRIDTSSGKPLAVLVNFTAHPTFMTGRQMMFSGGWPGHMQRTIESLVGDDVTAMYFNGAEGDIRPIGRRRSGGSRWELAEAYGRDLGIEIWKKWQTMSSSTSDITFRYHREVINLPKRQWHPDFMETGGKEYGLSAEIMKEMLPQMFPAKSATVIFQLGDLVVVGVPGEMAAQLGLKIKSFAKKTTGAKHPVIGGLGDEWISYILAEDQYAGGGYESSVSFYGPKLGPTVVETAKRGIQNLAK